MKINLILQGKGGVGKSFVASLLTQYYRSRNITPLCFDTDPVQQTFAGYESYGVTSLDIMNGPDIDPRAFDPIFNQAMETPDSDGVMIIDNGASSFVPLCSYLVSGDVLTLLAEGGHDVRIHAVLTGGQALDDTFAGLMSLAAYFPDTPLVVWKNLFFGPLEKGGVSVDESEEYKTISRRVLGEITLPNVKKETFGHDVETVLKARQSFDEAIESPYYEMMARQRLKMYWRQVRENIERARL